MDNPFVPLLRRKVSTDVRDVGIGMLGSGFIGEFHVLGLRHVPAARVVANYGAGAERREVFAKRFGSRPFDSIEAVCADPDVDLVVVSLPNHLHVDGVRAATAYGKAVACTKPLGRNATEAAEMLRLVQDAGLFNAYLENVVHTTETTTPAGSSRTSPRRSCERSSSVRPATSARRPTSTRAGCSPFPTRRMPTATTR